MNPYAVVAQFEHELCEYTGAKYAVAVNSCSSALLLCFAYWRQFHSPSAQESLGGREDRPHVSCPSRTYQSVPMAIIHARMRPFFRDEEWAGEYRIEPLSVWDSARRFHRNMFRSRNMQCVSFQTSKILGLEQGGAILHDNTEADEWLRRARFDGRLDHTEKLPKQVGFHCYMNPSTAALGIAKLACLPDMNADNGGSYMFEDLSKLEIWK